jgi:hypothetical protein
VECNSYSSSSHNKLMILLYYLSNTTLLPVSVTSCLSPSAPSPSLALIPVTQPCPRFLALGHLTFPLSSPPHPHPILRTPSPCSCVVPRPVTSSLRPAPIPSHPVILFKSKMSFPQQQCISPYLEHGRFIMFSIYYLSSHSDRELGLHQI